jgi:hypothetical protein
MKFKSNNLSYLIGALQGDGCFCKYYANDRNNRKTLRHVIRMEAMDLEMVKKVQETFNKIFNRNVKIYKGFDGVYEIKYLVKTLIPIFKKLDIRIKDPPIPPKWVNGNINFFGPYLAGVIDSDGSICIKRPQYPQCNIKIYSGHPQLELKKSIERHFKCKVFSTKEIKYNKIWKIWTSVFRVDFTISPKNVFLIEKYLLPYLTIPRKSNEIKKYIKQRWSGIRESNASILLSS